MDNSEFVVENVHIFNTVHDPKDAVSPAHTGFPAPACGKRTWRARQGPHIVSGSASTVMSEGRPRGKRVRPSDHLRHLSHGRRCDASMPASPSSDHQPLTDPVPIGDVLADVFEELLARQLSETED